MKEIRGKVAFVTGGASGIGLGIAEAFVEGGMQVVIADLRQDHIDEATASFARRGQSSSVQALRLDVTDRAAMAAAAEQTEGRFGKVHVLVNNAGVGIQGPLNEASYEDWDFGLAVNLGGVVNGIQTFLPRMRAHGEGGHIVNTASLAALVAFGMPAMMAIYVTAKAAVVALSESIRADLSREGIGVSVLCPGPIKTNIHEVAKNHPERFPAGRAFRQAEEMISQRTASAPRVDLPGWMEPADVGALVVKAVRNDEPYIITHGEWRPMYLARHEAVLRAMPEKVDPGLLESMRMAMQPRKP